MKLCMIKNSRALISKMTIVFSNSSLKILQIDIFFEKSKVFTYVKLYVNLIMYLAVFNRSKTNSFKTFFLFCVFIVFTEMKVKVPKMRNNFPP